MYRLLIVDDEPWVLRSLLDSVDWRAHGFEPAETATDGEEALACMARALPDLVVTDIRMPEMDGLEMIERARSRWPQLQFIILSGHAEFEYARRAMASGVAGYCLKPVQAEEMETILAKVRSLLDAENARRLEALLSLDEACDAVEAAALLARLGIRAEEMESLRVVAGVCRWGVPLLPGDNLMLLRGDEWRTVLDEPPVDGSIGISQPLRHPARIGRAVAEAREARRMWFATGTQGVFVYRSVGRIPLERPFARLAAAMDTGSEPEIRQEMDAMERLLVEGNAGWRQLRLFRERLEAFQITEEEAGTVAETGAVAETEPCEEAGDADEAENPNLHFRSLHEMIGFFADRFVGSIGARATEEEAAGGDLIAEVIRYADQHAIERISLIDLAERFHFSPSYLCRVFKRETGTTLTDHLLHIRLGKATALLENSTMPIAEIAERCGYPDYFYFTRLFKRTYGVTPTAWRAGEGRHAGSGG